MMLKFGYENIIIVCLMLLWAIPSYGANEKSSLKITVLDLEIVGEKKTFQINGIMICLTF